MPQMNQDSEGARIRVKDQAFVNQEVIDGADLDPGDLRCPQCHRNTFVVSGQAQMAHREVWEQGEVVDRQSDPAQGGSFDIERMDCLHCNKTYLIRSPELFRLERENLNLQTKNAELRRELIDRGGTSGGSGANLGWLN